MNKRSGKLIIGYWRANVREGGAIFERKVCAVFCGRLFGSVGEGVFGGVFGGGRH
jgi:hypothetical protein